MAYELTGKVKLIGDLQTFNSGFTKKEIVVVVEDGNYPQEISLEFLKDNISLLDSVIVGQNITVTFDIRGREYNGRYFNNLVGWKISGSDKAETPPAPVIDNNYEPFDSDKEIPF
jgi:single-strand DNA-binding protein